VLHETGESEAHEAKVQTETRASDSLSTRAEEIGRLLRPTHRSVSARIWNRRKR